VNLFCLHLSGGEMMIYISYFFNTNNCLRLVQGPAIVNASCVHGNCGQIYNDT